MRIIDKHLECWKGMVTVFIDLVNACNSIRREKIWSSLRRFISTTVSYKKIETYITILEIWFNQNLKEQEGSK
jgi:hypothetical protein